MKAKLHARWLALSTVVVGLLCQTGPCGLTFPSEQAADDFARNVGQLVQQSATNAVADTLFFFLDNMLVRLSF